MLIGFAWVRIVLAIRIVSFSDSTLFLSRLGSCYVLSEIQIRSKEWTFLFYQQPLLHFFHFLDNHFFEFFNQAFHMACEWTSSLGLRAHKMLERAWFVPMTGGCLESLLCAQA